MFFYVFGIKYKTMTQEKEKQNARFLLFADFSVSPEKALLFINDMAQNPNKAPKYNHLLMQNLAKQEAIKEKPREELKTMVRDRVEEWKRTIGSVSTQEYVMMSKQWDIPVDDIIDKRITPELIKEILDFFVMGQEKYKTKLAVAFFTYLMHGHQSGLFLPKSNLLVCGPSGSGKTYGMQVLSKLFHVPFVTIHCNSLVQEGIVGQTITDGFTSLITQRWLPDEVERAVVCFDEFDKLFEKKKGGDAGHYNARIINELLNIIDDKGEIEFRKSYDNNSERVKLPTRKMMFVFTGVFDGLRPDPDKKTDLSERMKIKGFTPNYEKEDTPKTEKRNDGEPTVEDFVEFGVKPEIMGRIQNFVFLDALSEDEMVGLFDLGAYSPFSEFEQYFSNNGIDTILTDEGKHTLAHLAIERKLGVRGLKSLLQQVLLEDMYDLEVGEDHILKVTKEYIMDNLNK